MLGGYFRLRLPPRPEGVLAGGCRQNILELSLIHIFLGGGAVETILNLVLSNIPGMPYAVQMCMNNYLSMDLTALVAGDLTGTNAFLDGGITLAVVVVLAALVMRRRSLA